MGCLTFDMSGSRKHAKRAGGCPLDGGVRRSLTEGRSLRKRRRTSKLSQRECPEGGRAVFQSASEQHDQKAPAQQRAHVQPYARAFEGAPLKRPMQP